MTSQTVQWVALIAVAIIALGGWFTPFAQQVVQNAGGVTGYDEVDTTALKVGGANGSRIGPIIAGQCALIGTDASQTGTSTAAYDCAVTGVVSGDTVFAQIATTSTFIANRNWAITGAKASTTAGFITVMLSNFGQTSVPSVIGVGSSTQYLVLHPVSSVPGL